MVTYEQKQRARKIVKQAAKHGDDPSTCEWLIRDERGAHEKTVLDLLDAVEEKSKQLKMSDEEVDAEVAQYLYLLCLEAQVRHLTKTHNAGAYA